MTDCVFCKGFPPVKENNLAYVLFDINPISKGHALIILKRHIEQVFDVTPEEWSAINELLKSMRLELQKQFSPDGFNIWINNGRAAGQVVMHAHVHLIPRFTGEAIHIKDHLKGNIE